MEITAVFDFSFMSSMIAFPAVLFFLWGCMAVFSRAGGGPVFFITFFIFFITVSLLLYLLDFPLGSMAVLIAPCLVAAIIKKTGGVGR